MLFRSHHTDIEPSENNVAQLATTAYTKENVAQAAYSGVVYQDDNGTNGTLADMADDDHRAVKAPFRVIDRVDVSSAAGSGSLGGDGRAAMAWSGTEASLMTLLYSAADAAALSSVIPLDLQGHTMGSDIHNVPATGIRKRSDERRVGKECSEPRR